VGDEGFEPYRNVSHAFVKTAQTPRKHSSKRYFDGLSQKRILPPFCETYCQELSGKFQHYHFLNEN